MAALQVPSLNMEFPEALNLLQKHIEIIISISFHCYQSSAQGASDRGTLNWTYLVL